jgi:ATP-dependent protease ClpP protease subunit
MSYIVTCNLQPIGRFQGQATDVDIARKEIRNVKIEMVLFFSISCRERELTILS